MDISLRLDVLKHTIDTYSKTIAELEELRITAKALLPEAQGFWEGNSAKAWYERFALYTDAAFPASVKDLKEILTSLENLYEKGLELRKQAEALGGYLGGGSSMGDDKLFLDSGELSRAYSLSNQLQSEYRRALIAWSDISDSVSVLRSGALSIGDMSGEANKRIEMLTSLSSALRAYEQGINDLNVLFSKDISGLPLNSDALTNSPFNAALGAFRLNMLLNGAAGFDLLSRACAFDPIDMATGNFFYKKKLFELGGILPFGFSLYYNSRSCMSGSLGCGWSHSFSSRLVCSESHLSIVDDTGAERLFMRSADTFYQSLTGILETVEKVETGFVYKRSDGLITHYSTSGALSTITDRSKNTIKLTYAENTGLLANVKASTGQSLLYVYNKQGNLESVIDHTGRSVGFVCCKGVLETVTDAMGNANSYSYDKQGYLNTIKDSQEITLLKNTYDREGRVVAQRVLDGKEVTLTHNEEEQQVNAAENGRLVNVFTHDKLGRTLQIVQDDRKERYSYNNRNLRLSETDARGLTTRYRYDDEGHLALISDAQSNTERFVYDKQGHLMKQIYNGILQKQIAYQKGKVASYVDAMGHTTSFEYNQRGQISDITCADGAQIVLDYDDQGNLKSLTDPLGRKAEIISDALGRITTVAGHQGVRTFFSYDKADNLVLMKRSNGQAIHYAYNSSGDIISIANDDGSQQTFSYDEFGNTLSEVDAEGNKTEYSYDNNSNLKEVRNALGAVYQFEYDKHQNLIAITNPENAKVRFSYDRAGNRTTAQFSEGAEYTCAYDAINRPTRYVTPEGATTEVTYHTKGQFDAISYPDGSKVQYSYDAAARVESIVTRNNTTLVFKRDAVGRILEISNDGQVLQRRTYDQAGNIIWHQDALGNETKYEYSLTGKLEAVEDALGSKRIYRYDERGHITSVLQDSNTIMSWRYNKEGNITAISESAGNQYCFEYDKCGRLISRVDPDMRKVTLKRDRLGNPIQINRDNSLTRIMYDKLGRIERIDGPDGLLEIKRLPYGQKPSSVSLAGVDISYSWDRATKLEKIEYPQGENALYKHDELGRLSRIDFADAWVSYDYDECSRPTLLHTSAGIYCKYSYTESGLLEKQVICNENAVLHSLIFSYDLAGNVVRKAVCSGRESYIDDAWGYQYDKLHRLVKVIKNDEVMREFTYDTWGNRVSKSEKGELIQYSYNKAGQLIAALTDRAKQEYFYDKSGNLVSIFDNGNETWRYRYDENSRLIEVLGPEGKTSYSYDVAGNLKERITPNSKEHFLFDPMRPHGNLLFWGKDKEKLSYCVTPGGIISNSEKGGYVYIY